MVILGEGREREAEKLMAMEPERSKQMHNFPMPCLKWGTQRFLRCMKVNPKSEVAAAADRRPSASEAEKGLIGRRRESEQERQGWIERADRKESFKKSVSPPAGAGGSGEKSKAESDGDDGIEAFRAKVMFDIQTAADKMKVAILREGLEEEPPPPPAPVDAEAVRPWNLRTRRAACKSPKGRNGAIGGGGGGSFNGGGAKSLTVDERRPNFVNTASAHARGGEKRERAKFSVSLSRREIEEDFKAITGHRPPRRPKKRTPKVQNQLDCLFPGLWLSEITADIYKVPDAPNTGKS